ncbi:Major exported protein [Candidatus Thiomargarita nelsonii]|uniref:Major exported protein n=1 Tax=Candidatus Thiomargarita nelsonii TaxID=1003181 RepID=A0A0A6P6H3_9GAMM|nr:Major exported protein [Candidatus Thiomargarita nelsonii]
MPQVAYVTTNGVTQGLMTAGCNTPESMGNKYQQDHTDESTVLEFDHELIIPRDPQTGQPTGQRVHRPVVYRTRYDKATPLMNQALCTGERLPEVIIKWYRTTMEGTQEHYYTHTLTDATIIGIKAETALATDESLDYRDHEVVYSLVYRKIKWEHVVAGTSGEDDWRKPVT